MATSLLVVDDDPAVCQLLTDLLTEEHYRVRSAPNGRAALACHRAAAADLIVSDVMMPELDGPGLVAALRAAGDVTPVVLLSALPPGTDAAGTVALPKPFDLERLLTVIARLLAERGTPRSRTPQERAPRRLTPRRPRVSVPAGEGSGRPYPVPHPSAPAGRRPPRGPT